MIKSYWWKKCISNDASLHPSYDAWVLSHFIDCNWSRNFISLHMFFLLFYSSFAFLNPCVIYGTFFSFFTICKQLKFLKKYILYEKVHQLFFLLLQKKIKKIGLVLAKISHNLIDCVFFCVLTRTFTYEKEPVQF